MSISEGIAKLAGRTLAVLFLLLALAGSVQAQEPAPVATHEDELQLQVVILKSQLAQALAAGARCEADGPQAVKVAQDAQTTGQALLKALDARGLMLSSDNKIVAKPAPPPPAEAPKKPSHEHDV
jgi:hypothetical protein